MLGEFTIAAGNTTITASDWPLRNARRLVQALLLAPGYRMHREQLFDLFWPDLDHDAAGNSLYQTLYHARHALAPLRPADWPRGSMLRIEQHIVSFVPPKPLWADVEAFEAAAATAREQRDPELYLAAINLYGGDLLPDHPYDEWLLVRRESLRESYITLLLELARVYESEGSLAHAITTLRRLLADDPVHEAGHVQVMRLYAQSGERQQALRQYQRLRDALRRDLGVEPDESSRELYEAILEQRFPVEGVNRLHTSTNQQPAARGPSRRPTLTRRSLPVHLTSFIGHHEDITRVANAFTSSRLLTLTGPGGVGKTRLATRVAEDIAGDYPDGLWFVDLGSLSDPSFVPQSVATVLNAREAAGHSLMEDIVARIGNRSALLVLDNCEHLVEACASLADRLLRECPNLRFLATSREALHIPGEVIWPVRPLTVPDPAHLPPLDQFCAIESVQLFIERSRAIQPGFAATDDNKRAIAEICHRLEGLPLAVELAAARVNALSVEDIADRLDDSLRLLTGGARTVPNRQQTLRAAIDWTYHLLSTSEQSLFRRLSVFRDGCSLDAAEYVCATDAVGNDQIIDLLIRLVDRSLVTMYERDGATRYRLLEPIRQYGHTRLSETGEIQRIRERHRDWYLRLAEEAGPELWHADQAAWLNRLETEHENLREALEWSLRHDPGTGLRLAGRLWWFWRVRGHFTEGRQWLESLLEASPGRSREHARGLLRAGILAVFQGERAAAQALLRNALDLNQEIEDRSGVGWALANLGLLDLSEGRYDTAGSSLDESLRLLRESGDLAGVSWALVVRGDLDRVQGDYDRAWDAHQESLAIRRQLGDRRGEGWALMKLGNVARVQEDYETARELYEAGWSIAGEVGDTWAVAWNLSSQGMVAFAEGDYRSAQSLLERSLAIFQDVGDRLGSAYALFYYGLLMIRQGASAPGTRLLSAASQHRPLQAWLTVFERDARDAAYAEGRTSLGEELFSQACSEGREMRLDQAIEHVLDTGDR